MNILIHCELHDFDYLESEIRSFERDLKMRNKLFQSEKIILKSIRLIMSTTEQNKLRKQLQEQKQQLIRLKNDPFERQLLNSFDFIYWLEKNEKIRNTWAP